LYKSPVGLKNGVFAKFLTRLDKLTAPVSAAAQITGLGETVSALRCGERSILANSEFSTFLANLNTEFLLYREMVENGMFADLEFIQRENGFSDFCATFTEMMENILTYSRNTASICRNNGHTGPSDVSFFEIF